MAHIVMYNFVHKSRFHYDIILINNFLIRYNEISFEIIAKKKKKIRNTFCVQWMVPIRHTLVSRSTFAGTYLSWPRSNHRSRPSISFPEARLSWFSLWMEPVPLFPFAFCPQYPDTWWYRPIEPNSHTNPYEYQHRIS